MADDDKKVIIPKDVNDNGKLDGEFTEFNTDYSALPGVSQPSRDDIPFNKQPSNEGVQPVSVESAQEKVGRDASLNQYTPGVTENAESRSQFLLPENSHDNINRKSRTFTLGEFIKQGAKGQRITKGSQVGTDSEGAQVQRQLGGQLLQKLPSQEAAQNQQSPHGRSIKGQTSLSYGENQANQAPVSREVSSILKHNRFSAASLDTVYSRPGTDPDEAHFASAQPEIGAYTSTTAAGQNVPAGRTVTLDEMKGVALNLIHAAMGDAKSGGSLAVKIGSSRIPADSTRLRNLDTGSPGSIDRELFEIAKASSGQFSEPNSEGETIESFGQLNSPDNPFGGFLPIEMVGLAFLVVAATGVAVEASNLIAVLIDSLSGKSQTPGSPPLTLGSFKKRDPGNLLTQALSDIFSKESFGIVETSSPFSDAVREGVKSMLGIGSAGVSASDAAEAIANITRSPGFFTIFGRTVLRDVIVVQDKLSDIGEIFSQSGFSAAGVSGAMSLIDVIKSSKLVAALNTFAIIGDAQKRKDLVIGPDDIGISGEITLEGDNKLNYQGINPAFHAIKSREDKKDIRLAWRNASTPSMYLLPESITVGQLALGKGDPLNTALAGHSGLEGITRQPGDQQDGSAGNRISRTDVIKHEQLLDSEYVPFYFHDLRTNEIISFHAFLNDLSDDYSAGINSQNVIGRADPVRIYRNTSRSIRFSFYIAATSKSDFDEMWFKINKLITMLYPQYTEGRLAQSGASKFIMPFSQVQAASPLVRLRIGDVIRSNYSKYNLARLFGLGGENLITPKFGALGAGVFNSKALEEGIAKIRKNSPTLYRRLRERIQQARKRPFIGKPFGLGVGDVGLVSYPSTQRLEVLGLSKSEPLPLSDVYIKVEALSENPVNKAAGTYIVKAYPTFKDALNNEVPLFRGANLRVDHSEVTVISSGLARLRFLFAGGGVGQAAEGVRIDKVENQGVRYVDEIAELFKGGPEGNAVVRSFESVEGKGLPGYVSRIGFRWIDRNTTWETEFGSRAPKICNVSVSFDPIHDIAPGIDHRGYNRAPVYQVGDAARSMAGDLNRDAPNLESESEDEEFGMNKRAIAAKGGIAGALGGALGSD